MKRPHRVFFPLFAVALAVAGCSTPTPYGPALDGKGYSERQTESDRFRVSFSGNSLTPRETVETYLLYRAAEITLQRGYDHFRIVEQDLESKTSYRNSFGATSGFYSRRSLGFRHGFHSFPYSFSTVTSRPIVSYEAVANIIVYSDAETNLERSRNDDNSYNARDVVKQLESYIERPEVEAGSNPPTDQNFAG